MVSKIRDLFKKLIQIYIRNWREQDDFERYAGILFAVVVAGTVMFAPVELRERFLKYLNLLSVLFVVILYKRVRNSKRQVVEQKKEIEQQKRLIEEHQQETIDSITYAKRIQEAILPRIESVRASLPDSFVLYKPKAIVAGDFYWMEDLGDVVLIAAADCTGHGVPGAMVSVVCNNALNRTVKEFKIRETGAILDKVTELVIETFEKSVAEVKDGMDISLLSIDKKSRQIQWSGANNPLWYFEDGGLKELKPDKQPIGMGGQRKAFTTHTIIVKPGTTFYLFTDGFADQFGGPKGKKFKYKQLQEQLQSLLGKDLAHQEESLDKVFEKWRGGLEQVDDVCVVGVRI